jgi:hypothetical protein
MIEYRLVPDLQRFGQVEHEIIEYIFQERDVIPVQLVFAG